MQHRRLRSYNAKKFLKNARIVFRQHNAIEVYTIIALPLPTQRVTFTFQMQAKVQRLLYTKHLVMIMDSDNLRVISIFTKEVNY